MTVKETCCIATRRDTRDIAHNEARLFSDDSEGTLYRDATRHALAIGTSLFSDDEGKCLGSMVSFEVWRTSGTSGQGVTGATGSPRVCGTGQKPRTHREQAGAA